MYIAHIDIQYAIPQWILYCSPQRVLSAKSISEVCMTHLSQTPRKHISMAWADSKLARSCDYCPARYSHLRFPSQELWFSPDSTHSCFRILFVSEGPEMQRRSPLEFLHKTTIAFRPTLETCDHMQCMLVMLCNILPYMYFLKAVRRTCGTVRYSCSVWVGIV